MKLLILGLAFVASTVAAKPLNPREWHGKYVGQPTRVLTLATVHLVRIGKPVTPDQITPLLKKLAAFAPTVITHEGIAGEQCETLARNEPVYPGIWDPYCWDTEEAGAATSLSVAQASAEVGRVLANWPAAPTAAQRRHLASLFLAANDRMSAQVQWRRLSPEERHTGDGIDDALVKILTRAGAPSNESYDIAVALAVRLGLERVYAVDDHTADSIRVQAKQGFGPAVEKLWKIPSFPVATEMDRRENDLKTGEDLLDYYRFLNRPATGRALVSAEYGAALKQDTPDRFGRQYVAWWETRNLRMVSNVRAAFGNTPGARVLNIVGASHKPYFDAYLGMMSDVKIVDAKVILK
jgi:hypothetical protein